MSSTVLVVFVVGAIIALVLLICWDRINSRRKESRNAAEISRREANRHYAVTVEMSLPLHDASSNQNESARYPVFTSPYPPQPPPLGFGHPTDEPSIGFHGYADTDLRTASCHPPTRTPPYPLENTSSMPQPSASRSHVPDTSHSVGNMPYPLTTSASQLVPGKSSHNVEQPPPSYEEVVRQKQV